MYLFFSQISGIDHSNVMFHLGGGGMFDIFLSLSLCLLATIGTSHLASIWIIIPSKLFDATMLQMTGFQPSQSSLPHVVVVVHV